jgi:hypothetical protein
MTCLRALTLTVPSAKSIALLVLSNHQEISVVHLFMTRRRRVSERDSVCKGILRGFMVGKNKLFTL